MDSPLLKSWNPFWNKFNAAIYVLNSRNWRPRRIYLMKSEEYEIMDMRILLTPVLFYRCSRNFQKPRCSTQRCCWVYWSCQKTYERIWCWKRFGSLQITNWYFAQACLHPWKQNSSRIFSLSKTTRMSFRCFGSNVWTQSYTW